MLQGRDEDDSGMELCQRDVDENLSCIAEFLTIHPYPLNETWGKIILNIRYACSI